MRVRVLPLQPTADIKSHSFKIFRKYLGNSRGISVICRKDGVTVTDKELKFAEIYTACGNAVRAATEAGYSAKTAEYASNWLNPKKPKKYKPELAEYIRQLAQAEQDKRILTAGERKVQLSDIIRSKDELTADRIKAIDTLNKMTGEYTVKVDAKVEQSEKLADVMAQIGGEGLDE